MSFLFFKSSALGVDKHLLSDGSGLTLPQVVSFVPQDAFTIRVLFNKDMFFHVTESLILRPSSYAIGRQSDGVRLPIIRCDKVSENEVDLTVIGQEATLYDGMASSFVLDAWGNGIDPAADTDAFNGTAEPVPAATWLTSLIGLDGGLQEQLHAGFIPDLNAPYLQNRDPAPFETSVAQDKVIEFELMDDETGVDVDEVQVWIEGVLAWENDAPEAGFTGVRTPIAGGHHFSIDQLADFDESQTVSVRVKAQDFATILNYLDETYSFITFGTSPALDNLNPFSGELDVDPSRHVFLDIVDPETGVNASTVWIKLGGLFAWQGDAPGPGFSVVKSIISGGFSYDIIPPGGTLSTGTNIVQVYALNNAENPDTLNTSYQFSTLDLFPPYLQDQDPAPGARGVETTRPVAFTISDDDGVVLSTVRVYIRQLLVYNGSAFLAGWSQSFVSAGGVNGYTFVVVPDPSERWREGETIEVSVIAEDPTGGVLNTTYEFTCGEELFPFSSYRFVLKSVREMDKRSPGMLQPLLEEGIDETWRQYVFDRLTELQATFYDPIGINAAWLPWLKAMVGFTRDLPFVATEAELRKIIRDAAPYWNAKPTELGLKQAIRLVTGNRFKVRDWFDLRMMGDQVVVTEQLQDYDPNVIGFGEDFLTGDRCRSSINPSTGYPWDHVIVFATGQLEEPFRYEDQFDYLAIKRFDGYESLIGIHKIEKCVVGERYVILEQALPTRTGYNYGAWVMAGGLGEWSTEIRIVNEPSGQGAVNLELVKFLMEQVRNAGERVDLVYVAFLDEFESAGDIDQWDTSSANVTNPDGGAMLVRAGEWANTASGFELDWYEQSTIIRVRGQAGGVAHLRFWYIDDDNTYWVRLDFSANEVSLWRRVTATTVQLGATHSLPNVVIPGQEVSIRIEGLTENPGVHLRVRVNGELFIDEYGAPPTVVRGGPGIQAFTADCELLSAEVMTLPVTVDRVGPNP